MFIGKETVVNKRDFQQEKGLLVRDAVVHEGKWLVCQRCGSKTVASLGCLPNGHYYCPQCLAFGRLTDQQLLVQRSDPDKVNREVHLAWSGKRTAFQERIANRLVAGFLAGDQLLLWAVTGAGKTEMLFPLIKEALSRGGRICISAPRIDVCRELLPRLQEAFPLEDIVFLYGEGEAYRETAFLVATTHQLLHFHQAFDLLVLDEIDAFPYEGDDRLKYASNQAVKENGCQVFLSATPSQALIQECGENLLCLPARYHRRPLIQPQRLFWNDWRHLPDQRGQLKRLVGLIKRLLVNNHLLIFCPSIEFIARLETALGPLLPGITLTSVSSKDQQREEKVTGMRQQEYQVLLTSTILERGVTFSQISVLVLGADHPVFSKAALVQIAGRVDRKGAFNYGEVIFCYHEMTFAIRQACEEIKRLNRLAVKEGAIDEMQLL